MKLEEEEEGGDLLHLHYQPTFKANSKPSYFVWPRHLY